MTRRTAFLGAFALAGLFVFTDCKQGQNERCQINSDCEEGLVCELQGTNPSMGGICRSTSAPTPTNDLSMQNDLSMPDLATPDLSDGGSDGGDGGG